MYENKFNKVLREGRRMATVCQVEDGLRLTEMAGLAGFDAILLDCEHMANNEIMVQNFIRACEVSCAVPFVRTRRNDPETTLGYLDAGAMGILFPNIKSVEDAERAVEGVRFPPLGKRGLSCTRSFDYGFGNSYKEYIEESNREITIMLMIETPEAVENIDAILEVPGVNEIELGTTDLSFRMGHPGDREHPEVLEAVEKVMESARRHHIPVGSIMREGMVLKEEMQKGYGVMTLSIADELAKVMCEFISVINQPE